MNDFADSYQYYQRLLDTLTLSIFICVQVINKFVPLIIISVSKHTCLQSPVQNIIVREFSKTIMEEAIAFGLNEPGL